ncbi:Preprotein translocase subunit SecG [Actinokineospora spheciospongiae]|uniref:Protein-export membrane protein SecG n=2 Tax=Pseudonocardiaceae TaxID=2070 RepID=W7IS91_9PSEU|nr:Preprotein translocase subunit SecG [Actinokineospora spheciospongiae]
MRPHELRRLRQKGGGTAGLPLWGGGRTRRGHQVACVLHRLDSEDEMTAVLILQIALIVTSLLLILLVLLHRGRGGGLSSLFGGGMQSSLSGSSVVEKNLDRITLFVGSIWIICVVGLGLLVKVS